MRNSSSMRRVTGCILFFLILLGMSTVVAAKQLQSDEVKLIASDPVAEAEFGRSVAIDGDLVAVGAGGANAGSTEGSGAVYLFKRKGQRYFLETKLTAPDASTGAEFGRAVAVQGNQVIVGARFAEVNGLTSAGAAYVYRKHKGAWRFEEKITSPTPVNEDNFGRALAVQGNLLVVTARKENLGASDVGAAYVYLYEAGQWIYSEKLTAGDPTPKAYFGQSVAIQGDLLAIGARNADPNGAGAVYLFLHSGNSWTELAKVTPPEGGADDQFGFSIAMTGNVMAVGARRADLPGAKDAGVAYVYTVNSNSINLLTTISASDAKRRDEFGQSLAMAGDVIAVGAWNDDGKIVIVNGKEEIKGRGSVYLFRRTGNSWIETKKLTASDGKAGDEFGYSLAASGNKLVTGAHFADLTPDSDDDSAEGAAYVLTIKP